MTLGQLTMIWLLQEGEIMRYHEMFIWLLDGLFWWSSTPLVLYASIKIPLIFNLRQKNVIVPIFYHLLIVTALNVFVNTIHYFITNPLMFWVIGKSIPVESYLFSFFVSYTASFGQYMLLVVGFNKASYIYRYHALEQQHFKIELANEQLRGQLANAQLQSLKMQLNPHFLFNTLHSVVSLMIKNDIRKATQMITTLSDLLRTVLVNQQADFIPLREELQLTKQYMAIQQIRFQDRLRVEYDIDPTTELWPVPQLILQPLVENSFTHGISELTTNALIKISTRLDNGNLHIELFDNGVGVNHRKHSGGMGLGIKNTISRIQQAYGDSSYLTITQPSQGGTVVNLIFANKPELKIPNNGEILLPDHR